MREILFRGKKEYGFGWCYGSYMFVYNSYN